MCAFRDLSYLALLYFLGLELLSLTVYHLPNSRQLLVELSVENLIEGVFSNQVMAVHTTLLPDTMGSVFGLLHRGGRPVKLRENDCAGFCECESHPRRGDAEYSGLDIFLGLELVDPLEPQLTGHTPIDSDGPDIFTIEEGLELIQQKFVMAKYEHLHIILHDFVEVLLDGFDLGLRCQAIALYEALVVVAVFQHLQLGAVADAGEYCVDLLRVLAVGIHQNLLPELVRQVGENIRFQPANHYAAFQ